MKPIAVITCTWKGYDPITALESAEPELRVSSISLSASARHLVSMPELTAENVREWLEDNGLSVIRSTHTGQARRTRQWAGKYSMLIGASNVQ